MIPRNTEFPTDRVFSIQCFGERMADGTYCDYGRLQLYVSKDGTMRDARFLTELGYRFTSPSAFPLSLTSPSITMDSSMWKSCRRAIIE